MRDMDPKELLQRYNDGTCSNVERALVESWFLSWKDEGFTPSYQKIEETKDLVWKELVLQNRQIKIWPWMAAAALIAISLTVGLFYTQVNNSSVKEEIVYGNDFDPGKSTAVLTFSNGTKINLSQNKTGVVVSKSLAYTDGSTIENTDHFDTESKGKPSMVTASTPRGGTYQITLPDGTIAQLNALSSITFPATFSKLNKRIISLSGEAYFEVAKDKAHPFVVETTKQRVEVLGTHFNINSYADQGFTKTTLLEGAVVVSSLSASDVSSVHTLSPGQQSILKSDQITVRNVAVDEAIGWTKGAFVFADRPLAEIMNSVSRWYDVEVVYENEAIKEETFGVNISRTDKASKILNLLEMTGNVHFKVEGRRIIVTK